MRGYGEAVLFIHSIMPFLFSGQALPLRETFHKRVLLPLDPQYVYGAENFPIVHDEVNYPNRFSTYSGHPTNNNCSEPALVYAISPSLVTLYRLSRLRSGETFHQSNVSSQ